MQVDRERRFISFLAGLGCKPRREIMRSLRSGPPGTNQGKAIMKELSAHLPPGLEDTWRKRSYLITAYLFMVHPMDGGLPNFGRTLADVGKDKVVEKRFKMVLDCEKEELPRHLEGLIRLIRKNSIPIDWGALLKDISDWGKEDKTVQRRWAEAFWQYRGRYDLHENLPGLLGK